MENKNLGQKIQFFCTKYLLLIISILILIIGLSSLIITAFFKNATYSSVPEITNYKFDNIIFMILGCLAFLLIMFILYNHTKKIKTKWLFIFSLLIISISQLLWVYNLKFIPRADQEAIIVAAKELLQGNFEIFGDPGSYFGRYPFQLGIIYYIALIFKIFNTTEPLILQIFNVGFSIINILLMYKITKQLFKNKKIEKIILFLLLGFSIYFLFFNVHIYGNINGLTFALIALYNTLRYLKTKNKKNLVVIAVTIAISIILKSNYNIFLCGIIIILGLDCIKNKNIINMVGIILILLTYLGIQFLMNASIEKCTNKKVPEGTPMIGYIYMGMAKTQKRSAGWYDPVAIEIYEKNNYNTEMAKKENMQYIKARIIELIKNPKELICYYSDKIASTWLNPTYQTIWCASPGPVLVTNQDYAEYIEGKTIVKSMLSGTIFKIEEQFLNIFQTIVFMFAFYALFNIYKTGRLEYLLLPIIFLGGFVFHVIWETKAIYVLQYYYLLLPYTAYGITRFIIILKKHYSTSKSLKKIYTK